MSKFKRLDRVQLVSGLGMLPAGACGTIVSIRESDRFVGVVFDAGKQVWVHSEAIQPVLQNYADRRVLYSLLMLVRDRMRGQGIMP